MPEETKPMTPEKQAFLAAPEKTLLELAAKYIALLSVTKWTQETHGKLVAAVAKKYAGDPDIFSALAGKPGHGILGNASQFRQWLEDKHAEKGGPFESKLIAKQESIAAKTIADVQDL